MKYYCENCGTEYSVTSETEAALESYRKDFKDIIGGSETKCGICQYIPNSLPSELRRLPARETVAQWEERKGRKYPDTAPVYVWRDDAKAWGLRERYRVEHETWNIQVVATEAGAPPDDWRPEWK